MNKQEAIEEIKKQSTQAYDDFAIMQDTAIHIVNQIDEPQKPVIPKFVAEWIDWCKANNVTLLGGISPIDELGSAICGEKELSRGMLLDGQNKVKKPLLVLGWTVMRLRKKNCTR